MKTLSLFGSFRRLWSNPIGLLAASVVFSGILLGEVNWLASQHYSRVDLSPAARYSLSEPTLSLLRGQSAAVELTITLTPDDPFFDPLRHLLDTYRAATPLITSRRIDPKKEPIALQAETRASAAVDVALIARRGEKRIFVTRDKFTRTDPAQARRSMEQTISNAIADALDELQVRVCFPTGHGEPSIDDVGTEGLAPLRDHLKRLGFSATRKPLDVPEPSAELSGCSVIVVAAPLRPYPREHERALLEASKSGSQLILVLPPIIDQDGSIVGSGLDALLGEFGLGLERGFLIEEDPSRRLPEGMGEIFFAEPEVHPVTEGLSRRDERRDARPLVVTAGAITIRDPSTAQRLLGTSPQARLLRSLSSPEVEGRRESHVVGAVAEHLSKPAAVSQKLALFSYGNLLYSVADPTTIANRILLENSLDWIASRKSKLSLPSAPRSHEPLTFTEESLGAVLRYVLVYIPSSTAALGVLVLFLRRRRSRSESELS